MATSLALTCSAAAIASKAPRPQLAWITLLLLPILAFLSFRQIDHWRSDEALFLHAVRVDARQATARECELLELGASGVVLCERRVIYDQDDVPLENVLAFYDTARQTAP